MANKVMFLNQHEKKQGKIYRFCLLSVYTYKNIHFIVFKK